MQIAQNQTFDVQLSISTIKSSVQYFSDILFIRSYTNSITRHPSVVWSSRSISSMVTPTVFQINSLKYYNVCFSSSLNPQDIKSQLIQCNDSYAQIQCPVINTIVFWILLYCFVSDQYPEVEGA
ncbi:Hypothetical_protein [Hexamita inflata]|uniref:Hypothetical_protein n=1 Tax=Hexamita inflata TaxID=28002 RepID=A0AA86NMH6_9EUKA|nr:Hypothetical protein HINF_LOCUS9341 [Hexamita inflata]